MIEFAAQGHAALEQRHRLIEPALRPCRGSQRHVDPRLRPVVRGCRALRKGVVQPIDRIPLAGERPEDHGPTVDRDHEGPHDLMRTDRNIDRGREYSPLLEHLLGIGRRLPDRHRVGKCRRLGAPRAPPPGGHARARRRLRSLGRKLDRQQPLGMRGAETDRLLVSGNGIPPAAELVLRFTDRGGGGDRVDPALVPGTDPRPVIPTGRFQGHAIVAVGQRRERGIKGDRRHGLGPAGPDLGPGHPQAQQGHHREDRGRSAEQRLPGNNTPHTASCTPSPRARRPESGP